MNDLITRLEADLLDAAERLHNEQPAHAHDHNRQDHPAKRRWRRKPLAFSGLSLAVLAAIAAGMLMLADAGGSGRLDLVAQAKAALVPPGMIVHLITTSHMELRGGSQTEIVGPEAEQGTPRVTER